MQQFCTVWGPYLLGNLFQRLHHSIIYYGERLFAKSDGEIVQPIPPIPRNITELDNVADTAIDTLLKLMQASAVTALFKCLMYRIHEPDCRFSRLLREFFTGLLFRPHVLNFKHSKLLHVHVSATFVIIFKEVNCRRMHYKNFITVLFIHQLMHQWVVLKNDIKIYIKTAPTCFGVRVTPSTGSALICAYKSYSC